MNDTSPLFVSANELLAHAVELYTQGNERKYKFFIFHLANAIELIQMVNDMIRDLATPSFGQAVLAVRLVQLGANPVRLREMTIAEATEYLAASLAQLI